MTAVVDSATVLCGFHHVAVLTRDLDRLIAFHRDVFGSQVLVDTVTDGIRNVFVDVGGGGVLHAFQTDEGPAGEQPRWRRGRLDHFAVRVPDRQVFRAVRRRLLDAGATDGRVREYGGTWFMGFTDPDGMSCEITYLADPVPLSYTPRLLDETELGTA